MKVEQSKSRTRKQVPREPSVDLSAPERIPHRSAASRVRYSTRSSGAQPVVPDIQLQTGRLASDASAPSKQRYLTRSKSAPNRKSDDGATVPARSERIVPETQLDGESEEEEEEKESPERGRTKYRGARLTVKNGALVSDEVDEGDVMEIESLGVVSVASGSGSGGRRKKKKEKAQEKAAVIADGPAPSTPTAAVPAASATMLEEWEMEEGIVLKKAKDKHGDEEGT